MFFAFKNTETSVDIKPIEGGQVTDLEQYGTITKCTYKKTGLISYYIVNVLWENGEREVCYVGPYPYPSLTYRMVYLKVEVTTEVKRPVKHFIFME